MGDWQHCHFSSLCNWRPQWRGKNQAQACTHCWWQHLFTGPRTSIPPTLHKYFCKWSPAPAHFLSHLISALRARLLSPHQAGVIDSSPPPAAPLRGGLSPGAASNSLQHFITAQFGFPAHSKWQCWGSLTLSCLANQYKQSLPGVSLLLSKKDERVPRVVNSRAVSMVEQKVQLQKQEPAFILDFCTSLGFSLFPGRAEHCTWFYAIPWWGGSQSPSQEQNFSGSCTWLETAPRNSIKCQPQLYSHHVMGMRTSGLNNYCLELRQ